MAVVPAVVLGVKRGRLHGACPLARLALQQEVPPCEKCQLLLAGMQYHPLLGMPRQNH